MMGDKTRHFSLGKHTRNKRISLSRKDYVRV